jgi:hypothetical protein
LNGETKDYLDLYYTLCSLESGSHVSPEFWVAYTESFENFIKSCSFAPNDCLYWESYFAITVMLSLKYENFLPNSSISPCDILHLIDFLIHSVDENCFAQESLYKELFLISMLSLCSKLHKKFKLEPGVDQILKLFTFLIETVGQFQKSKEIWENDLMWRWIWKEENSVLLYRKKTLLALQFVKIFNEAKINVLTDDFKCRFQFLMKYIQFSESNVTIFVVNFLPFMLEDDSFCEKFLVNKFEDFVNSVKVEFSKRIRKDFSPYLLILNSIARKFHGHSFNSCILELFFDMLICIYHKNMEYFALYILGNTAFNTYLAYKKNGMNVSSIISLISNVFTDILKFERQNHLALAELSIPLIEESSPKCCQLSIDVILVMQSSADSCIQSENVLSKMDFSNLHTCEVVIFKALNNWDIKGNLSFLSIFQEFFRRSQEDLLINLVSKNSWALFRFSKVINIREAKLSENEILFLWVFLKSTWIYTLQYKKLMDLKGLLLIENISERISIGNFCCYGEPFRLASILLHLRNRFEKDTNFITRTLSLILNGIYKLEGKLCHNCHPFKNCIDSLAIWRRNLETVLRCDDDDDDDSKEIFAEVYPLDECSKESQFPSLIDSR